MRCPDCHKSVEPSKQFCPYCGAAVPKSEQVLEKKTNPKKKGIYIVASLISAVITFLCFFLLFYLIVKTFLPMYGQAMWIGVALAWNIIWKMSIFLVVAAFVVNSTLALLSKDGTKIPYYIAWGILCVGGVFMCAFLTPKIMLANRIASEDILSYALNAGQVLGIIYGLGVPLLQAALFVSFVKPVSLIKSSVVIFIFTINTFGAAYLGMCIFRMGIASLMLTIFGSVLAFAASVAFNGGKDL